MNKPITHDQLRQNLNSYFDQLSSRTLGSLNREHLERCRQANLAALKVLVQDAENWNNINPDGTPQVLVPADVHDSNVEKARLLDKLERISSKDDVYICKTPKGLIAFLQTPDLSRPVKWRQTFAAALEAVVEVK